MPNFGVLHPEESRGIDVRIRELPKDVEITQDFDLPSLVLVLPRHEHVEVRIGHDQVRFREDEVQFGQFVVSLLPQRSRVVADKVGASVPQEFGDESLSVVIFRVKHQSAFQALEKTCSIITAKSMDNVILEWEDFFLFLALFDITRMEDWPVH